MSYRHTLEKYKGTRSRHTCPACGHRREFTRYIDTQTSRHLADYVGRCNRGMKCGYHYTPKQYFAALKTSPERSDVQRKPKQTDLTPSRQISFIPFDAFRNSLTGVPGNNFVRYLLRLFDAGVTGELIKQFYIGTSNYWNGSTVFWQIDVRRRIRGGKVMLYDPTTGRRVKETQPDGSKRNKITWAHSILQRQGLIRDFNLRQCLFGEHQLITQPKTKPVAIVEAEKTAIIATPYLPSFVWLACGSLTNLTEDKCRVLRGREVILFPDLNAFEKWSDKAKLLRSLLDCNIVVSDLLERKASETDRRQGFDLADYLGSQSETGLPQTIP